MHHVSQVKEEYKLFQISVVLSDDYMHIKENCTHFKNTYKNKKQKAFLICLER